MKKVGKHKIVKESCWVILYYLADSVSVMI